MSKHDPKIRLRHMLDAAEEAVKQVQGKEREDLDREILLMLGMTRLVEMIGEAANWIPREVQEQYPDIPWTSIVGMRNRIIHEYDKVDLDILWRTVKERLPELVKSLNEALN